MKTKDKLRLRIAALEQITALLIGYLDGDTPAGQVSEVSEKIMLKSRSVGGFSHKEVVEIYSLTDEKSVDNGE